MMRGTFCGALTVLGFAAVASACGGDVSPGGDAGYLLDAVAADVRLSIDSGPADGGGFDSGSADSGLADGGTDAGLEVDAGAGSDSGADANVDPADSGTDAGVVRDAGHDANVLFDAGRDAGTDAAVVVVDAGVRDSGTSIDAGTMATDAFVPLDSGAADSGTPELDAGPPTPDAGADVDAGPPFPLARVSNTSCFAPARPVRAVTLQTPFADTIGSTIFAEPTNMSRASTNRYFVSQRAGRIATFVPGVPGVTTALDITDRVTTDGDSGVSAAAPYPNFGFAPYLFVSYTAAGTSGSVLARVSRFESLDGGATYNASTESVLLEVPMPESFRTNADLEFGPDGLLYIGLGDGGASEEAMAVSQNPSSLRGKILRIDVNGPLPYAVPSSNPYASGGGAPEVYARGFRNPWRFSWDAYTEQMYVGDVGEDLVDEIDLVVLGGNYGWPYLEGATCRSMPDCLGSGFEAPQYEYEHSFGGAIALGAVYRGFRIPALFGQLIFADFVNGSLMMHSYGGGAQQIAAGVGAMVDVVNKGDGELVGVQYDTGTLAELFPAPGPVMDTYPAKLSETGCFDPESPSTPVASLIPYDLNAPLWSDAAHKARWLSLPDGATVTIDEATGDMEFPAGTLLIKQFEIGGSIVETRFFVRFTDGGWAGYAYQWNEAQTDADLIADTGSPLDVVWGTQTWQYPSRPQCMECHSEVAGRALGPELGQLNRDMFYSAAGVTVNELAAWESTGVLGEALPVTLPFYPPYASDEPIEDRAKAYLHSNCSHCHQPGGPGVGGHDLRFATPLASMRLCNVGPVLGDLDVTGATRFTPGDPDTSVLYLRMNRRGERQMPIFGTLAVDPTGVGLVSEWIESVTTCP